MQRRGRLQVNPSVQTTTDNDAAALKSLRRVNTRRSTFRPSIVCACAFLSLRGRFNRGLFQRLSGFETGHPAAAGPMPAFVLSVSDEQDAAFLVSVMDCSDCDSSGLDSPNSSWSIARLKEYLRRKKRPSKREKSRAS